MSIWSGSNDESWFDYERLQKYRVLKNPEKHANFRGSNSQFYLLSVDVGRFHDQTVCTVYRVNINNNRYIASIVNIFVLGLTAEKKTMREQAIAIKQLIFDFKPKEVVIDTNGVGAGLADEMILEQEVDGIVYPSYGFINDENYKKIQPSNSIKILYGMKANATLKPQIHKNVFTRINAGKVRFLIREQEAKTMLLETQLGKKMSPQKRAQRLLPHDMTTKLFEEILNLRLKKNTSSLDIVLEQINKRYPDDKYMSFAYGLWRIKELEEENTKKVKRTSLFSSKNLVFYTPQEVNYGSNKHHKRKR